MKKATSIFALSLMLGCASAQADVQIVNSYMDYDRHVAVIGDASKLGESAGFANNVSYKEALKIMFPGWTIINRAQSWPPLYVSWTKDTPKIEIIREMNRRGNLFFYVDQKHREITVERRTDSRKPAR